MPSDSTGASADIVCPNCDTRFADRYCPHCAQVADLRIPTVRRFLADLADKTLAIQSKLPLTLKVLFTQPGGLTLDYLQGRRERYLKPLNLYVAVTVLFFLLLSLVPGIRVRIGGTLEINTEAVAESRIEGHTGIEALDQRLARFAQLPAERQQHILRDGLIRNAPRAMAVLVPLFALLLMPLYPQRYYGEHLLFALHFHSFAFLALLPGLVPWPQALHDLVNDLINLLLLTYLFLALRRVYGGGLAGPLLRLAVIVTVYVLALSGAALGGVLLAVS